MNLDDLKIQLNKKIEGPAVTIGESEFALLLKRSSKSLVHKLQRSLRLETIFSIVFTAGCLLLAIYDNQWSLKIYFGIFIFVGAALIAVLLYLLQRIKKLNDQPLPVKQNLVSVVKIMEDYKKRSFQFSMALIPACIFLSIWLSYKEKPEHTMNWLSHYAVILSIAFIAIAIGIYYANKWILDKLYGRHIRQLKENLEELEEEERN
ncbi:MAG: hypothetical protein JWN76_3371 [Chitinophagaceae bacterium]|nr:hypothetical protein [Chitinophagaceae bacterium]